MKQKTRWWRWLAGLLVALVFPAVALVAVVTYAALRRRWPDRLVAWLVAVPSAAALALLLWQTDYLRRWAVVASWWLHGRQPEPADWVVIAVTGLVGPLLGAAWWAVRQWQRERTPFAGRVEKERRQKQEERRRKRVLQVAQWTRHQGPEWRRPLAKPFVVGTGPADPVGPRLGLYQRGDLGGAWRGGVGQRVARLAMRDPANRHLVVLGATGMGKSESIFNVCEWAAQSGWQVIYLSAKEPADVESSAAPRLAAVADRAGSQLRTLVPGLAPYDPMRGTTDDVRDRLVRIAEWGDEYWSHCANLLLGLALDLSAEAGESVDNLPDLVYKLLHGKLRELAKVSNDQRVSKLVAALDDHALRGALMRYASMALHLRGWVAPKSGGGWSFEDADVACIELPTVTRPEAGQALLRLVMRDLGTYLGSTRRQRTQTGEVRRALVVVEEVGALGGDKVLAREFVNLVERARSAGAYMVISAQDQEGLGDERAQSALLTNCTVLSYRQATKAEDLASLAGTVEQAEAGADYDHRGRFADQGVVRMQHTFKLNPQELRTLNLGDFVLISAGRWMKVAAAMGPDGYRLPALPGVQRTVDQVNAGQQLLSLPVAPPPAAGRGELPGPRGDEDQDDGKPPADDSGW